MGLEIKGGHIETREHLDQQIVQEPVTVTESLMGLHRQCTDRVQPWIDHVWLILELDWLCARWAVIWRVIWGWQWLISCRNNNLALGWSAGFLTSDILVSPFLQFEQLHRLISHMVTPKNPSWTAANFNTFVRFLYFNTTIAGNSQYWDSFLDCNQMKQWPGKTESGQAPRASATPSSSSTGLLSPALSFQSVRTPHPPVAPIKETPPLFCHQVAKVTKTQRITRAGGRERRRPFFPFLRSTHSHDFF